MSRGWGDEAEVAKDTYEEFVREEKNQEKVISWKPMKSIFTEGKSGNCITCC